MEVANTGTLPCKGLLLGVNNPEVCCSGATLSNVGQGDHHMHSDSAADLLGLHSDTSLQDGVIDTSKPAGRGCEAALQTAVSDTCCLHMAAAAVRHYKSSPATGVHGEVAHSIDGLQLSYALHHV
jgi:hypothetical protein